MKLTDEDKKFLREMYDETEERNLKQIEDCSKKTRFTLVDTTNHKSSFLWYTAKEISEKEAINLLGRETFLSGMERAAFHRSAIRYLPNTNEKIWVSFSSFAFWK